MKICSNCGSNNFDGNDTCKDCGLMTQHLPLVALPERSYDEDKKTANSIIKFNTPDIEVYNYHSKKTKNKELKRAFNREKYYTKYSYFYEGYVEIKRMIDQLGLPKHVLREATKIWKELLKNNYFEKHYVKNGIFAALIKLSCGIWDIPITFGEVANYSNSPLIKIKKSYLSLRRNKKFSFNRCDIKKYLTRYLGEFNLSKRQKINALKMADQIEKRCNISGKKPIGYVAAIFNILGFTRKNVVEKFPISPPTVTKRKREIKRFIKNGKR